MKRMLQVLALVQALLVVALAVRVVGVWTTPPPEFGEIPELPATTAIPPARPPARIPDSVTQVVVDNDLFDEKRGEVDEFLVPDELLGQAPVQPPSTVRLVGVMMLGGDPVGILLDPAVRPEQVSVREGEMFGEYQVGPITPQGVTLLGGPDQRFSVPLRVEAQGAGALAPAPPPNPAGPNPAGRPNPPPKPGTPAKGVTAKPTTPRTAGADDAATTARERAQAIAQRNAEARKVSQRKNEASGQDGGEDTMATPDPVQARLEALRQLREAAKSK